MASPLNRRTEPQRAELDIEALFASEDDAPPAPRRPDPPKLIFTQPADRNIQQFPDEPAQFAEEADPLDVPLLASPVPPFQAPATEQEASRRARPGMLLGLIVLLATFGVGAAWLMPRTEESDFRAAATPALDRTEAPVEATPPPTTIPAPEPPRIKEAPAENRSLEPARTAPVPHPEPKKGVTPPVASARAASADPTGTTATSGRTTNADPAIATRGETSPPPAATPVPSSPADLGRLTPEPAVPVDQPIAPPREVAPAPALRETAPAPRLEAAPAPPAAAPASVPAVDARAVETDRVRAVLSGYERAYSALDADAASRIFPTVDHKALSRAFSGLSAQQIRFDDCRIQVQQGTARATCAGTARWTPKVGGGSQQQARRWQFDLQQVASGWRIDAVKVQ